MEIGVKTLGEARVTSTKRHAPLYQRVQSPLLYKRDTRCGVSSILKNKNAQAPSFKPPRGGAGFDRLKHIYRRLEQEFSNLWDKGDEKILCDFHIIMKKSIGAKYDWYL